MASIGGAALLLEDRGYASTSAGNSPLPAPPPSSSLSPPQAHDIRRSRTWSAGNVSSAVVSEAQQSYLSSCSSSSHDIGSDEEDDVLGEGDYSTSYYYGHGRKTRSATHLRQRPSTRREREFIDVNAAAANIVRQGRRELPHHYHRQHLSEKSSIEIDIAAEMTHVVIRHARSNSAVDISDGDHKNDNNGDDDSDISSLEVDEDVAFTGDYDSGTFCQSDEKLASAAATARAASSVMKRSDDAVCASGDELFVSNDDNLSCGRNSEDRCQTPICFRSLELNRSSLFSTKALCGFEHQLEERKGDREHGADYDDVPSEMSYSLSTSSRPAVGTTTSNSDVLGEVGTIGIAASGAATSAAIRRRGHNKDPSKSSIAGLSITSAGHGSIGGLNFVYSPTAANAEHDCTTRSDASDNNFNSKFEDSIASLLLGNHPSTGAIIQPILSPTSMSCGLKRRCREDQEQERKQQQRWKRQQQQQRRLCHRRHHSESILNTSHHLKHSGSFGSPQPTSSQVPSVATLRTDRASFGNVRGYHRRSISAGCGVNV